MRIFKLLCLIVLLIAPQARSETVVATINEMITANQGLAQGQVSEDEYTIVFKNLQTGAVMNDEVTVCAVAPDGTFMFARDYQNVIFRVEKGESTPVLTDYKQGDKIKNLTVRYKANYIERNGEQKVVTTTVLDATELPETSGTTSVSYNPGYLSSLASSTAFQLVKLGKAMVDGAYNDQSAEWIPSEKRFKMTQGTSVVYILPEAMGIDVSSFESGTYNIYVRGVAEPTTEGCDIYPVALIQYTPKTFTSIADVIAEAKQGPSSNESYFSYILDEQVKINAASKTDMFIEDSTGAMYIKGTGTDFTGAGYTAGKTVSGLTFKTYYSSSYGGTLEGRMSAADALPTPSEETFTVEYPVVDPTDNTAMTARNCLPVCVENARVIDGNKLGGISLSANIFVESYTFNPHKYYTVKGIFKSPSTIYVTSYEETGDVPPVVPVEVNNIAEFIAKGASLASNNDKTEEYYKITGQVGVVRCKTTMYIQDESGAIMISTANSSDIRNNPYNTIGCVTEGLILKPQKYYSTIRGYFDPNDVEWPAVVDGASIEPEEITIDNLTSDKMYRWVKVSEVTASNRNQFVAPGLHTASKPSDAASVSTNSDLSQTNITLTKAKVYDIVGVANANFSNSGVTSWKFSLSSATDVTPVIVQVQDVAALREAVNSLADGQTSAETYDLASAFVTLTTGNGFFIQTQTDGFMTVSTDGADFECPYNYGSVVPHLTGKVRNDGGVLKMLVTPSKLPAASMSVPESVVVTDITAGEIADHLFVMTKLDNLTMPAEREVPTVSGMTFADAANALNKSDLKAGSRYELQGVCDGSTYWIYSSREILVAQAPVISPSVPDDYPQTVTITAAEGAKIFYTLTGKDPEVTIEEGEPFEEEGTNVYETPFTVSEQCTIKAVAFEPGKELSDVTTAEYGEPSGLDTVVTDAVIISGRDIVIPEGATVWNVGGMRVGERSLNPGVYIVKLPSSQTVKIVIR